MSPIFFVSILLTKLQLSTCDYLESEANYMKPKLERNNILNKGVWVRNKSRENLFEKTSLSNFVFRSNLLDTDRLLTNFDTFSENVVEGSPFVSGYIGRLRRSSRQIQKQHSRKRINGKKHKTSTEDSRTNSIVSNKKTNTYNNPYDVSTIHINYKEIVNFINSKNNTRKTNKTIDVLLPIIGFNYTKANITEDTTKTSTSIDVPKRSKKHNYSIDNKPFNLPEDANKSDGSENNKTNRNVFNKNDVIWHQNAPVPDMYEVVPQELEKTKGVTERGLIRVISMITKSFKKIMKQHKDIKLIHDTLYTMNDDFLKHINDMNITFQDFNSKYSNMVQFNDKLKEFENKMTSEKEYLENKHKEMDNNVLEFKNQQKMFLSQQKQFYSVQKVILAQNEKINIKQNSIAKIQSEISHRQNNFARILKKAKQLIIDRKSDSSKEKNYSVHSTTTVNHDTKTTTYRPITSETIKLNLFSIPTKNKLQNQDDLIMKEKDKRPIDDLVYKYYFNNTFIDSLMKSKILNNYASDSIDIARNVKNKRDKLETTILLPVPGNTNKNRVRRWINHFSNQKLKSMPRKIENTQINKADLTKDSRPKTDPFLNMATSFCKEIGQNANELMLNWCIEKALRRLKFMDNKLFPKPVTVMKEKKPQVLLQVSKDHYTTAKPRVTVPIVPSTVWMSTNIPYGPVSKKMYAVSKPPIFFPDNEELESNLKQYDLTPDMEGTVYYDGSLHFSDMGHIGTHDSNVMSDFMPGLVDSNSQIEMNPMAFDIQARRRAHVLRMNEDIMKKYKSLKL